VVLSAREFMMFSYYLCFTELSWSVNTAVNWFGLLSIWSNSCSSVQHLLFIHWTFQNFVNFFFAEFVMETLTLQLVFSLRNYPDFSV
jgi:hypothetical protein